MEKKYFVGIGGTGARTLESLVHLCAAGMGPDKLTVFLVDPDKSNGNKSRTTSLIEKYQLARKQLCKSADYSINEGDKSPIQLFRTEIEFTPALHEWNVIEDSSPTLKEVLGLSMASHGDPKRDFAELLFSEAELSLKLTEGFRGHPSIGSVLLSGKNLANENGPFKALLNQLSKAKNDTGVFLCGSIFGGTGAAGVPTFGAMNLLKGHSLSKLNDGYRVVLGAALVLPYFDVTKDSNEDNLCVDSSDFAFATKAALDYYHKADLAFDRCYLIGDCIDSPVAKFSTGKSDQNNDPHYIEMITALSAIDFWKEPATNFEDNTKKFFYASRESEQSISWHDIPITASDSIDKTLLKSRFFNHTIGMTLYSAILPTFGQDLCKKNNKNFSGYKWFKNASYDQNDCYADINNVSDYCEEFLKWIQLLHKNRAVQLLNISSLINEDASIVANRVSDGYRFPEGINALRHANSRKISSKSFLWDHFIQDEMIDVSRDSFFEASVLSGNCAVNQGEKIARHLEMAVAKYVSEQYQIEL